MSIFEASRTLWTSRMLSGFRIVAGLMFISYGTMKVFGYPPGPQPLPPFNPAALLVIAGMVELVGGTLIVLGLLTRPVALVLAGEMAVAYFRSHLPLSPFPTVNQGTAAVLYCLLFLYLTFAGAGVFSLDALIARRKWLERPAPNPELRPRPANSNRGRGGPVLHRG